MLSEKNANGAAHNYAPSAAARLTVLGAIMEALMR